MRVALLIALVFLMAAPVWATKMYGGLEFQTNFDSLMQVSRENNQPILIKFYTDW